MRRRTSSSRSGSGRTLSAAVVSLGVPGAVLVLVRVATAELVATLMMPRSQNRKERKKKRIVISD